MGEVYRAHDEKLGRDVAIKILPRLVIGDPGLRARFEREARVISQLNHPHICTLYGVGHETISTAGSEHAADFLVMEYLEGQTLAERLEKGPLPIERALQYAVQIAGAPSG